MYESHLRDRWMSHLIRSASPEVASDFSISSECANASFGFRDFAIPFGAREIFPSTWATTHPREKMFPLKTHTASPSIREKNQSVGSATLSIIGNICAGFHQIIRLIMSFINSDNSETVIDRVPWNAPEIAPGNTSNASDRSFSTALRVHKLSRNFIRKIPDWDSRLFGFLS